MVDALVLVFEKTLVPSVLYCTVIYCNVYPGVTCFTKMMVDFGAMQDPARIFYLPTPTIRTVALHDLAWHQQSTEDDLASVLRPTLPKPSCPLVAHSEAVLARGSATLGNSFFPSPSYQHRARFSP